MRTLYRVKVTFKDDSYLEMESVHRVHEDLPAGYLRILCSSGVVRNVPLSLLKYWDKVPMKR